MQTHEKQARLRAAQSSSVPADSANTPAGICRPEALLSHKNEAYLRIRPIPPRIAFCRRGRARTAIRMYDSMDDKRLSSIL